MFINKSTENIKTMKQVVSPPPGWQWAFALDSSPLFAALLVVILNLGGRYLALDISKSQEAVLTHPITRRIVLFAVLFLATRNVLIALVLTVLISIIFFNLLNEESPLYLGQRITPSPPHMIDTQLPPLISHVTGLLA